MKEINDGSGLECAGYNTNNMRNTNDPVVIPEHAKELLQLLHIFFFRYCKKLLFLNIKKSDTMVYHRQIQNQYMIFE